MEKRAKRGPTTFQEACEKKTARAITAQGYRRGWGLHRSIGKKKRPGDSRKKKKKKQQVLRRVSKIRRSGYPRGVKKIEPKKKKGEKGGGNMEAP